ncbi:alpha-hydroxy acid oxidase [Pseudactinotalea suaedae]|uniref:alpha-hydroxy acid oxidase n=1 Tax=Pseudactinotalea suaedae TaxID=1524924 RepID=UPI0012E165BD|nr:alpha-hydroxy acid oxidase [Pseudactinotalea suaedae]
MTESRWRQRAALMRPAPIRLSAQRRLERALTIAELRSLASKRVPRAVFDYVDGGADAEITLRHNRHVLDQVTFAPTVLADVATPKMSVSALGMTSELPFALAPTGFSRLMHHAGEVAVAQAAARAGIPYALATMGTTSPEDLVSEVPSGRKWFQLYIWKDREATKQLVQRAAAAGYEALIVTVDSAVTGQRLRDVRNGLAIPPGVTARTVLDAARHPNWWLAFLTKEPLRFASLGRWDAPLAELGNLLYDATVTVEDIAWIRALWKGPLVIKGVSSARDAARVAAVGPDAIVLSNHGGRQLDQLPHPYDFIDDARAQLPAGVELWVDSGFSTGADIISAYARGADLVLVGRAYLYGLMAGGLIGVERAIAILADEARRTLQLLGCASVRDVTAAHVRRGIPERPAIPEPLPSASAASPEAAPLRRDHHE